LTTIASTSNPRLKSLRRLQTKRGRAASGRFAAEGEDLVAAAADAGWEPVEGFRLAGTALGGEGFHDVDAPALGAASALGSGTRVVAVYPQRWAPQPLGPLCVYLHGVRDPGNVGTVLRSAQAFGASSVALGPGCADPHSPKAVRASMGAIFAVALARASSPAELPGRRIALRAGAKATLREVLGDDGGSRAELTLLVGSEREGLPEDVLAACELDARIPIASESLNAAMAATVALYETTRGTSRVPTS
jgi:RNA methyltransferase, TrmH family